MTGFVETFRGVVYPWQCDQLGHMNVQHYVGMFDQAAWHFFSMLGFTWIGMKGRAETFVDARHTVQYKAEQTAGALVAVESAVLRVGAKSVTHLHRMRNVETGQLAATSEIVSVYFHLERRESLEIPDELRQSLEARQAP